VWNTDVDPTDVYRYGHGIEINNMTVTYHLGFWLALLFYLLATGVNGYQYIKERK
jgi:hypothetical protein